MSDYKCACSGCGTNIAFPAEYAGHEVDCPNCNTKTLLTVAAPRAEPRKTGKLLIESLGCPNCGAPCDGKTRNCAFCGMVLIITGIAETFEHNLNTSQLAESIAKWRNQVAKNAEDAGAHYALGLAYLNSKLRDASLVHFRKAVLLAPEKADTHYNLALACFNDGNILVGSPDYAEAEKEIAYCVNLAPDFREAVAYKHFFVGRKLQQHITDASQALAEYRVAIEACPDIFVIQLNAGACFFHLKKYQEARTCLGRAAELSPKEPAPQIILCLIEYQLGEYAKGIETGMRAVALLGSATLGITQAEAHNNLALCLWKSERRAEALEHINKAIAHDPQRLVCRQNLQAIQATKPLELLHTTPYWVRLAIIGLVVIIFTIFVLKR